VEKGATIGYGSLWRAPGQARVATVAIGYADGVHRARANRGHVLVRGRRAPLIGMVSMDAIILDVSEVPGVQLGDTATLIGRDGTDAVLKVPFPDRESEHEALALSHWNGDGAVRLLEDEPALGAFLIERCVPGTPLSGVGQDLALDILSSLLPRLWKPAQAPPFRTLTDEASWWASQLRETWVRAGKPFGERLVDAALDALNSLPGSQGEPVLLH